MRGSEIRIIIMTDVLMSLMAFTAVISFYLKTNCAKPSEMKKKGEKGSRKTKCKKDKEHLRVMDG